MARDIRQIRVESILGGHSPMTHFAAPDQFLTSVGIDPALGEEDNSGFIGYPTGLLRPSGSQEVSGSSAINNSTLWIVPPPSGGYQDIGGLTLEGLNYFIYNYAGSIYTVEENFGNFASLGDLNDGGNAHGNGCAYYDNYMYFARDTTIARYGPFTSSTQTFTDDYWAGTLGKTALTYTVYPEIYDAAGAEYPNHVLHRHSDGKLYIADVVDNQGTIHYIKTRKTTAEGDTDDGSTFDAVHVGYKLYPTAMESYDDFLVIALFENIGQSNGFLNARDSRTNAKIAFWDTTSEKINKIIWVEYPDQLITAIKNVNGVLYFFSGSIDIEGYRVMRYVGGSSFEEVFAQTVGSAPPAGAVDSGSNMLAFGSTISTPGGSNGTVFALGINHRIYGNGIFSIHSTIGSEAPTAIKLIKNYLYSTYRDRPVVATDGFRLEFPSGYGNAFNNWYSQVYRIGNPGKILKVRIPLLEPLAANMDIDVFIHNDNSVDGSSIQIGEINTSKYPVGTQSIVLRPNNLTFDNSFVLHLRWNTGASTLCTVALPLVVDYELLNIDTVADR